MRGEGEGAGGGRSLEPLSPDFLALKPGAPSFHAFKSWSFSITARSPEPPFCIRMLPHKANFLSGLEMRTC